MNPKTEGIIFVLGAPGAGKGALSSKLASDYGFKHLSIGDLLRQVVASPDADKTVVEYVRRGELVTTSLLFQILKPHIEQRGTIILDGFPRRLDQAKEFETRFQLPVLVLFFDCPKDLAEKRVINRKQGREGDNVETFRKRHDEFLELNPPLVRHYEQMGKLITVDTQYCTHKSYDTLTKLLQARREWTSLICT
ncbi:UMP-CMP kinase [Trichoderma asperellum]